MFRFTVRELMLITLVVGLGLGWLLDRIAQFRHFEKVDYRAYILEEILYEDGYRVTWDDDHVTAISKFAHFECPLDNKCREAIRARELE